MIKETSPGIVFQLMLNLYQSIITYLNLTVKLPPPTKHLRMFGTLLHYTLLAKSERQCEMFLNDRYYNQITIFYVKLRKCPVGFSMILCTGKCECDPSLISMITQCNINDQALLRPANSWISAESHNNTHSYRISHNRPFHYCLPQSSSLNLSSPNS